MKSQKPKSSRLFLATIAANIATLTVGTCGAWTSPVLPKLELMDPDSPLSQPITATESGLISASFCIAGIFMPYIAGPSTDKFGRKWVILPSSIFFILGYALLYFANELWIIILARLFQGLGAGMSMTAVPMYVGEIATDNVRGSLGSLMPFFLVTGQLYVNAVGLYLPYKTLQLLCIILPIVFVVVFFFMPESPYYYASKDQKEAAIKSLQFFRGQSAEIVADEWTSIHKTVKESMANKKSFTDVFKNRGDRKGLIICASLLVFQQLSGVSAVLFNSKSIFLSTGTGFDPSVATLIVAGVTVASAGLSPFIVERTGRRIILMVCAIIMSISLAALGVFFYMQLVVGDISHVDWMPVPTLIVYIIFYNISYGSLPWVMVGEMFAPSVKSSATSISTSTTVMTALLVLLFYPSINELGAYIPFWIFSVSCIFAFFFTLFVVIETRGLSLQEIQDRLNK